MDNSLSASGSRYSFDPLEGSLGRDTYSPQNNLNSITNNQVGRQDSTGSQNSSHGSYSFNDSCRSNHSSLNSKARSSFQIQRDESNQESRSVASSPFRNAGSSKDLLEAAESKIEELRAEARMWEQNARKLMNDLEKLRKDLSDQSKRQSNLEMEISQSQRECSDLKHEIEQLKILLEESTAKQKSAENIEFQAKEMGNLQKELEDEVRFEKESNANLALQLDKTQESNIELVSILQELEDTIEKQKMEIANLYKMQSSDNNVVTYGNGFEDKKNEEGSRVVGNSPAFFEQKDDRNTELELREFQESQKKLEFTIQLLETSLQEKIHELEAVQVLKSQDLMDCEAQWKDKLSAKEEEIINLESKLSDSLNSGDSLNGGRNNLIEEAEVLRQKIEELEKDCSELTDENLELVLKLKQSEQDLSKSSASSNSFSNEHAENGSLSISESEISKLKYQICNPEEELNKKDVLIEQISTDHLQVQCLDLEKNCAGLEIQLQAFKDKTSYLDNELCKYHARAEEKGIMITDLQQQLESYQMKETKTNCHLSDDLTEIKTSESDDAVEMSKTLSELHEQIQSCLANLTKQQFILYAPVTTDCFFDKTTDCYYDSSNKRLSNPADSCGQKEQAVAILNSFIRLKDLFEAKVTTCNGELKQNGEIGATAANVNEIQDKFEDQENTFNAPSLGQEGQQMEFKSEITDELKSDTLLRAKEVEALRCCQKDLETQISSLQNEKRKLQEKIEVMLEKSTMSSICMDDSQKETMVLNSNMILLTDLGASQNDELVTNSSIDSHVFSSEIPARKSELECGKSEIELHLAELVKENVQLSERICGLEAQLRYLTDEKESSRLELQNSESSAFSLQQDVKRLKSGLEAEKGNRKQKLQEMQDLWLEAQAECEYLKIANLKLRNVSESLIDECSVLQKSVIELRKQKTELHEHCRILEAELRESRKSLDDMFQEVEALDGKYILTLEEIASKEKALCLELDMLLQDNEQYKKILIKEESLLNQMYLEKATEVDNLHKEIRHLTEYISANQDEKERTALAAVLEASQLRADKAISEASLQNFQGKLKLSESNLSTLQMESETKLFGLQNELVASKQNQEILMADHEKLLELLEDVKFNEEKHKSVVRGLELKLKASAYERLQLEEEISCLRVQLQKTALLENEILALKKSINEVQFENQRLEVSLHMLSGDYEEMKAEKVQLLQMISEMEIAVSELEHCKRNKISLEEKLLRLEGDLTAREAVGAQEAELKNELAWAKRANNELRNKIRHLQEENRMEAIEDSQKSCGTRRHICPESSAISSSSSGELKLSKVDVKCDCAPGRLQVIDTESSSKIQLLETKLAEASEANNMYKAQLKSFLLKGCIDHSGSLNNETDKNEVVKESEGSASMLAKELTDLRERYFHMSIKCAEVETEREQLMLKLRSVSNGNS
ncbi:uncharacterized protein LOC126660270 isoform X2 [Mercurialis annua]|uniref:uncharacterized protein LOC126660270 isoform X2 n=1 Tax=Mercurialis annua TaxID=3986 RepID=UPI00215E851D|nr:uncharacterized protein LOC126660270 isoform X2 [Mercurialis annua]